MKKLLGSTLALAMFVPTGANAELLKNLKLSGQLDVTAISAQNVTDFVTRPAQGNTAVATGNNDHIGHTYTRTMLSADWDLLDDVHGRVTLVKGAHNLTPRSATARPERTSTPGRRAPSCRKPTSRSTSSLGSST